MPSTRGKSDGWVFSEFSVKEDGFLESASPILGAHKDRSGCIDEKRGKDTRAGF